MAVWEWVLVGIPCEFVLAVGIGRFIAIGHGPSIDERHDAPIEPPVKPAPVGIATPSAGTMER
jgi:hypothetical protein